MHTLAAALGRSAFILGLAAVSVAAPAQDKPAPLPEPVPYAALQNLTDVMERVRTDGDKPVDSETLIAEATKGMLARVDPEGGEFYTKADARALRAGADPRSASAGLELRVRQGLLAVFPVEGGPAAVAGVRAGDWLRTIDGVGMAGIDRHEVEKRFHGEPGSKMVLGLSRGETGPMFDVEVERRVLASLPLAVERLDADVAVLRLRSFGFASPQEAAGALGREWTKRPFKGLVLDLRHNSGGVLQGAVGTAAIFLKPGDLVVKTVGRVAQANHEFLATPEDYMRHGERDPLAALPAALRSVPVVVVVDEATASGAEIVAAALRDHRRAILVGHVTFGRGSIQTVMLLPGDAAMKLTTAHFVTPSGQQIQGQGLQPDVAVAGDDEAQGLQAAVAVLRKRL